MTPQAAQEQIQKAIHRHLGLGRAFVILFGSRALGKFQRGSDYDIGLYTGEKIPWSVIGQIKADLEESDLPVNVDIVDFFRATPEFKAIALQGAKVWHRPDNGLTLI